MGAGAPYFLGLLAPFPIGVAFESAASTASEAVDGFARDTAIGDVKPRQTGAHNAPRSRATGNSPSPGPVAGTIRATSATSARRSD